MRGVSTAKVESNREEMNHVKARPTEGGTIRVQNAEGDPGTTAQIVVQNQVDYEPKVSVIIPVYNVEGYLRECLDSVVNQTLKEIEIICIDDGSTDSSLSILKEYAQKDSRISVLQQKNLHAGIARNTGIAVARGKYLSFLDGDDFFELRMLEDCYSLIEKEGSEILLYQYWDYNDQTREPEQVRGINKNLTNGESITLPTISARKELMTMCNPMPWNKLMCHQFIKDVGVRFQSQLASNDVYFSLSALACSQKITLFYKPYVYYRYSRKGSLRNSRDKSPFDFYKAYEKLYKLLMKKKLYKTYQETFLTSLVSTSLWTLAHTEKAHQEVKKFIRNVIVPKFIHGKEALLSENLISSLERVKYPDIIVSLTSYPARIGTVNQTIESLLKQSLKPDKLILWLAPEQFPNKETDLPQELLDLQDQGLTIGWYHDIGSYKKLIPTLRKYPDAIIVTADDDNIYERDWLKKLVEGYQQFPHDVQCHRVTKFFHEDRWRTIKGGHDYYGKGSFLNEVVGLGGVLYPPHCFYRDILDEELFMRLAPTNDDQWFWIQAVLNGVRVRVVNSPIIKANYIPGTQENGLAKINNEGENLFWKDFDRLIAYYPQIKKMFISERKREKLKIVNGIFPCKEQLQNWCHRVSDNPSFGIEHPKTFNEKIQWLKLYDSTPIKTRLADKYLVREWVKEKIGEKYLAPLLGVYDRFEDIDFNQLPNQFVIKCNHGCGYNIVVEDKSQLDHADAKRKVDRWMRENYAFKCGFELYYRNIVPKILIEPYITNDGQNLYDYKFWCFNGEVKYMQFRDDFSANLKMVFYDLDWERQPFCYDHPLYEKELAKPDNFDEMVQVAKMCCQGFPFACVDIHRLNDGTIKFGEITFTHSSGIGRWNNEKYNFMLGELIKLPSLAYDVDSGEYYKPKKASKLLPYLCLLSNWHKEHDLLERAKSLRKKHILKRLSQMRIDIKNFGTKENKVSIQAQNSTISAPGWFKNAQGEGCSLAGHENRGQIKIRSIKDGRLELKFMGPDKRFEGTRFPVWSDYKSIKIDGREVLSSPVAVWHDEAWFYKMPVKDGQETLVEYERQAHLYSREDLKETILRLNPTWGAIQENIDALTDEVYKIISQANNPLNEVRTY